MTRRLASHRYGLLFCIIKRRYFHDFSVRDDHGVCSETESMVDLLDITDRIVDEKLTFEDCCALFETSYFDFVKITWRQPSSSLFSWQRAWESIAFWRIR